jgi:hypothetical protein
MRVNQPPLPDDFGNPWMSNLSEIVLPEPVSWWPPAAGLLVLGVVAIAVGAWLVIWAWRRRAPGDRRVALVELAELEHSLAVGDRSALTRLPALVRGTALASYPRRLVATRTGESWLAFLDETLGTDQFSAGPGRALTELAYRPDAADGLNDADAQRLIGLCRRWLRGHRPLSDRRPNHRRLDASTAAAGGM